jgi:hypothetical protein
MPRHTPWMFKNTNGRKHASPTHQFLYHLANCDTTTDCWIWASAITGRGYGKFFHRPTTYSAHRFSYQHHNGKIPTGMHVLHRCDVKRCVNPAHLFLGTNFDNIQDKMRKGRGYRQKSIRGG